MFKQLKENAVLHADDTGEEYRVLEHIASGGQGAVYRVDAGGNEKAVKWYTKRRGLDAVRDGIVRLINHSHLAPPNFLWPLQLVESKENGGFGYVMELLDSRFRSVPSLVKIDHQDVKAGFPTRILAAYNAASSFKDLHAQGLCYRDVSLNNFQIDPVNGDVQIFDVDNVGWDNTPSTMMGTPMFYAPEIYLDRKPTSSYTDLYSLAVCLFYLLFGDHPFHGQLFHQSDLLEPQEIQTFYATGPFVYAPQDERNRPTENSVIRNRARVVPGFVKKLFVDSFTKGLADPHARVREGQWRDAFAKLYDSIFQCSRCKSLNLFDATSSKHVCWSCRHQAHPRAYLLFDSNHAVCLRGNLELYPHHVDSKKQHDFSQVVGKSEPKRKDALRNVSDLPWQAMSADGSSTYVAPGQMLQLKQGLEIRFQGKHAQVKTL